jgi:hypothetical protein
MGDPKLRGQRGGGEDRWPVVAEGTITSVTKDQNVKNIRQPKSVGTYLNKVHTSIAETRAESANLKRRPDWEVFVPILQARDTWPDVLVGRTENSATGTEKNEDNIV